MMAPRLPRNDALGEIDLNPISSATDISTTPITLEAARTLKNEYIHDINGLCMMSGLIQPWAIAIESMYSLPLLNLKLGERAYDCCE